MAGLIESFQTKWRLTGWTSKRNIPWTPTASRTSSREVFFKSLFYPWRIWDLGQEIVGFCSRNLLGFHGTLGYVWRAWIQDAMEGTQIKSLGVILEPSLSLLLPPWDKTLSSQQPPHPSYFPTLNKAARVSVPLGPGTLRRVTEERLMKVPLTQMPTGKVKLVMGQLGLNKSWAAGGAWTVTMPSEEGHNTTKWMTPWPFSPPAFWYPAAATIG